MTLQTARTLQLLLILTLLAGGAAVRLLGIDFGLPYLYDPDESTFVNKGLKVLALRDLNPGWFGHPGTVTIYTLSLLFAGFGAIGLATGMFDSVAEIASAARTDPASFYLLGRLMIASFALLTLIAVYRLGLQIGGRAQAVLATALLAVSPLHVSLSRLIRPDIQMTFFLVIVVYFCVRMSGEGRLRDYVLAGFFMGLAVATKYPAAVAALPIVIAHYAHQRQLGRSGWINFHLLCAGGLGALAGAFAGSPYLFLDFGTAWSDIQREGRAEHLSATSPGFLPALSWYTFNALTANFTLIGVGSAIVGGIVLIRRRESGPGWVIVSFVIAFLLFLSTLNLRWERWVLPILPFVSVLAGVGFIAVWDKASKAASGKVLPFAWAVIVLSSLAVPLHSTLLRGRELSRGDTRTEAGSWILEHVPPGSSILLERYTPQLPNGRYHLLHVIDGRIVALNGQSKYLQTPGVIGELPDPGLVLDSPATYVVTGSDFDRRSAEAGKYGTSLRVYQLLFDQFQKVYEIEPVHGELAGGPVRIFRRPEAGPPSVHD